MPSKIKDSPSKENSPCNAMNGHSDKDEPKEKCEEIKEVVAEKNNDDTLKSNNASYIEEDIDEGIGQSTKSLIEDMDTIKESDKKSDNDNFKDQEFVFIHDTGFTVKIVASGVEPFDIQVMQICIYIIL